MKIGSTHRKQEFKFFRFDSLEMDVIFSFLASVQSSFQSNL